MKDYLRKFSGKDRYLLISIIVPYIIGALSIFAEDNLLSPTQPSGDGFYNVLISSISDLQIELTLLASSVIVSLTIIPRTLISILLCSQGFLAGLKLKASFNAGRLPYSLISCTATLLISAVLLLLCFKFLKDPLAKSSTNDIKERKIVCSRKFIERIYESLIACGSIILINLIKKSLLYIIYHN